MSEPRQMCKLCGRVEAVRFHDRGFPPDAATRRLKRKCKAAGCPCEPRYIAGVRL